MDNATIKRLQGPILVLGASGFVGANLLKTIMRVRTDVLGTAQRLPAWRLASIDPQNIADIDLLVPSNLDRLFARFQPKTIFNCVAYGAYSFEEDPDLVYATNFVLTTQLLRRAEIGGAAAYIHCGSSSEYGLNSAGPAEDAALDPNSHYAVSKCASANLIRFYGKTRKVPCANLRLYSVYGPEEDSARLIPSLISHAAKGQYPPFADPDTGRDFVFADDVSSALIAAAAQMAPKIYGESINIGSGRETTLRELAYLAKDLFKIGEEPVFSSMANRSWDVARWYADPHKAEALLGWRAETPLAQGLAATYSWYKSLPSEADYQKSSKSVLLDTRRSISAIIACYRDRDAIPIMHQRLTQVFERLKVDYEIIFVNDGSPDDCEEVIQNISAHDRRVVGISHARNFGSQAAFRSGMNLASKAACVLLDGDLQDPPELIEAFVEKWRAGFDVVYGRRVGRDASAIMNFCYKTFYRLFNRMSYITVPRDAGDFSLIDRQVMKWLLRFPERDLFVRGLRAFVGFKQTGVDYYRPERMFGRSTNNIFRNIGWAKRGILSFSNVPLNIVSGLSVFVMVITSLMAVAQILFRLFAPEKTPSGLTTVIVTVLVIGSINLLGIAVLGEYIAKIFEETKRRPHYIRRGLIRGGAIQKNLEGEDAAWT